MVEFHVGMASPAEVSEAINGEMAKAALLDGNGEALDTVPAAQHETMDTMNKLGQAL